MQNPLDKLFGIHAQALSLRSERSELLASNLANSDTPNFKARDIDFKAALNSAQGIQNQGNVRLMKSSTQHMALDGDSLSSGAIRYRVPTHPSLDGNTVDSDHEKSAFTENAIRYQISLSILNKKINGLIAALRGE